MNSYLPFARQSCRGCSDSESSPVTARILDLHSCCDPRMLSTPHDASNRSAPRDRLPAFDGVPISEAVTKKCVTLWVALSFIFKELRRKLLCTVCHFFWGFVSGGATRSPMAKAMIIGGVFRRPEGPRFHRNRVNNFIGFAYTTLPELRMQPRLSAEIPPLVVIATRSGLRLFFRARGNT